MSVSLPPGTVGLSTIDGHTGAFVKFGQRFLGAKKVDYRWSHAFLVGENNTVYEAMPAGIQHNSIQSYLDDLARGDEVMFINVPLTNEQRERAVAIGDDLVDRKVGYSFLSYLYLTLRRLGLRTKGIRALIARTDNMMCSQTTDYILTEVGYEVFADKRAYQDVIPSDFARLVREDNRFSIITVLEKA